MRPGCLVPLDHEARQDAAIPNCGSPYAENSIPVIYQCNVTLVTGCRCVQGKGGKHTF